MEDSQQRGVVILEYPQQQGETMEYSEQQGAIMEGTLQQGGIAKGSQQQLVIVKGSQNQGTTLEGVSQIQNKTVDSSQVQGAAATNGSGTLIHGTPLKATESRKNLKFPQFRKSYGSQSSDADFKIRSKTEDDIENNEKEPLLKHHTM